MEIECKFVNDNQVYTCQVTKASIITPSKDIVSFKGNHLPGRSNNDVSLISFSDSKVEYFPRNLQRIFPNLNTVTIHNCSLKEISRQDLIGLEKLVELSLYSNKLKSLPDDLFKKMQDLRKVNLKGNNIEFASSKLIEPIVKNQLDYFYLQRNTSINEFYTAGGGTCKTIQELMAKIDEKCKPPEPQVTSNSTQTDSSYGNREKDILKVCNEFRRQGLYTDFVISVGTTDFPVNKNILASQSSILAEMFTANKNGRFASKLEIFDMSYQAVEAFLDYLYEFKQPDKEIATEVFKLAAKYEVAELKTTCEQIIHDGLDHSNALEVFKLACGPYKSKELKIASFRKLQETFGVELDDDLMNNPENLEKIVETKKLLDEMVKKARTKRND